MLISTKLSMPPAKARMVPRSHLLHRLSEGKDARLIVISGLAGSGKTSLVCRWIKEENLPVAWYSLDKTDSDPDVFFRYLLTALGGVDPTLLSIVEPLLQEQKRLFPKEVIPLLVEHLIDQPRDIYIVLDDYHLIRSKEIHDALSYLLDFIPPGMHIVILSRHAIPFSLSRFRVRSQIVEIPASDMKFSYEETEQFFSEIMPVNLSTPEIHELARYTEGWVGGLQLFGLSLKNKETLGDLGDILSRACQETTEYLIDEVMEGQPEKVKTFLRMTALLDRFNTDLCREITSLPDASDLIDHLYRNNLFLFPLNTERTWHRYHHLLSEAIRKGVRSSPLFTTVHKKAALWFASQGYLEDAFRHAFTSGDNEFAADLLEDHLFSLHERYEIASGLRWLAKVPHDIFMQRALLRLHECTFRMGFFQHTDIEAILRDIGEHEPQVFDRYEGEKKTMCRELLDYLKYILPYCQASAESHLNPLMEDFRRISPDSRLFSGFVEDIIIGRHLVQEDVLMASGALKEAEKRIVVSENAWARVIWSKSAAYVERWQGSLLRAETVLVKALQFLERKNLSDTPFRFTLYSPMAWIFYYRNDLAKALEYAIAARDYVDQAPTVKDIIEGNNVLGFIYAALGEKEKLRDCIQRMQTMSRTTNDPKVVAFANALSARMSAEIGDFRWVEQWSMERKLSMDEPFSFCYVHECLAQVQYLFQKGRYGEADRMLQVLRVRCVDQGMLESILDVDLVHCATLYALGEKSRSKEIMRQAMVFAEAEGYVQPFVTYAPIISAVFTDLAEERLRTGLPSYLEVVLKACGISVDPTLAPEMREKNRKELLSQREMEILQLIAEGYKYREIAEKACISLDTVRTHTKHIYGKLNVKTRLQAIRRSEELKFFEDRR